METYSKLHSRTFFKSLSCWLPLILIWEEFQSAFSVGQDGLYGSSPNLKHVEQDKVVGVRRCAINLLTWLVTALLEFFQLHYFRCYKIPSSEGTEEQLPAPMLPEISISHRSWMDHIFSRLIQAMITVSLHGQRYLTSGKLWQTIRLDTYRYVYCPAIIGCLRTPAVCWWQDEATGGPGWPSYITGYRKFITPCCRR